MTCEHQRWVVSRVHDGKDCMDCGERLPWNTDLQKRIEELEKRVRFLEDYTLHVSNFCSGVGLEMREEVVKNIKSNNQ